MGNKYYLSGGCDLPGKLLYEKLDKKKYKKKKKKKAEVDYKIMPENLNKNSEQKRIITLPSPLIPLLYTLPPPPLPPHTKSDLDSLSKFTY